METALFIKENGDTKSQQELDTKRIDSIFLRSNQSISIHSIGLCSAISSGARAYLCITDSDASTELLKQTIDLASGNNRHTSFYKLAKPVEFKKGKFYCLSVEVFGGPTFTFLEIQSVSRQRDLTLEISKKLPYRFSFNFDTTMPEISLLSPNRKSKTDQPKTFKEESKDTTPIWRKSVRRKTVSQNEAFEGRETAESPSRANNLANANNENQSPSLFRRLSKIEKSTSSNQISGILFTRPDKISRGCC